MPHIIVEYSEKSSISGSIDNLLRKLQNVAGELESIRPEHLSVRAHPLAHSWRGAGETPHMHIDLRLLVGRSQALKETMARALYTEAAQLLDDTSSLSVEVSELGVYCKG